MSLGIVRLIQDLSKRVKSTVARAVLEELSDAQGVQLGKFSFLAGEVRNNVERLENYGFSSVPPEDSEAIVIFPNGDRSRGYVVACDSRADRPKDKKKGETYIWTKFGHKIYLKENGDIDIYSPQKTILIAEDEINITSGAKTVLNSTGDVEVTAPKVLLTTPECQITGNLVVGGNATAAGVVTGSGGVITQATPSPVSIEDIVDTYNTHTHPENGDGGGTTSAPNESI